MKPRPLGNTGLIVPPLCLGCMSYGTSAWRPWVLDETPSRRLLAEAVERGFVFFDTANAYSGGESERVLGRFLRDQGLRDKAVVATKVFYQTPDRPDGIGLARENIRATLDGSLQRLGLERVDLLQTHRWDEGVPIEETMETFRDCIRAGKVRAVGASNLYGWQLAQAQMVARAQGWEGFVTLQPHWNLLYREDERELIPAAREFEVALLPWSPLARGRLARRNETARAETDDVADVLYGAEDDPVINAVWSVAEARGVKPAQIALAWLMAKDTVPIIGATKLSHLDDALGALDLQLTAEEIATLEAPYRPRALAELPTVVRSKR
jgi:aryl-alcohol dehydrogenase-like predicted oxidoreductase